MIEIWEFKKGLSKPVSRILYPSQVKDGDHLSSPDVTIGVMRPTRGQAGLLMSLYLVLLQMGFAQPAGHPAAGGLLLPPFHPCSLPPRMKDRWRYVSVALSVGFPLLGVTQHPARWSSDFPPR